MPLNKSCSLEALSENIAAEIKAGRARDQAVAIAYRTLRDACESAGKPTPSRKEQDAVAKSYRRAKGEQSDDYLKSALAGARDKLHPRDFAVIHHAAMSSAGGRASARQRMTVVEKASVAGARHLTGAELSEALLRVAELRAADVRRGMESGASLLEHRLEIELARRAYVTKSDPGAADAHVNSLGGRKGPPKKKEPVDNTGAQPMEMSAKADRSKDPGVMIALKLPINTAQALAIEGGEPPESLHITLAYIGRMSEIGIEGLDLAQQACMSVATTFPLKGTISGVARFAATASSDDKDVIALLPNVLGLRALAERVCYELTCRGLQYKSNFEYLPHITLAYVDPAKPTPRVLDEARGRDLYFDAITLSVNDADTSFPLGSSPPPDEEAFYQNALVAQAREAEEASVASPTAPAEIVLMCEGGYMAKSADGETIEVAGEGAYEPGDIVELTCKADGEVAIAGPSSSLAPAYMRAMIGVLSDAHAAHHPIPFQGPEAARVVFVSGAPNELELARKEAVVGADGVTFLERYLDALGVAKSEVAIGFACPVDPGVPAEQLGPRQTKRWESWVRKSLAKWPDAVVVALGKAANEALGDRALLWLPHPLAARVNENRYGEQVDRKLRRVRKALDDGFVLAQDVKGDPAVGEIEFIAPDRMGAHQAGGPAGTIVRVAKSADEKQIVYGAVLDPYEVDTQGEWVPPAIVEKSAHGFLDSRVIGREHTEVAEGSHLVESWVEPYPSPEDYKAAMQGLPHTAYVRKYGSESVKSGTWMIGVKLSNGDWAAFKRGDFTGFSIGGFSFKATVPKSAMPKVKFVDLVEQK